MHDAEGTILNTFETVINAPIPEIFYHYTNATGMMGIVDKAEIWCTHTQYLNDSQEFKHAIGLFCEQIGLRLKSDADNSDFLKSVYEFAVGQVEYVNVCVASFSTEKDSLSQWRAYANAPGGYAIGFSAEKIKK